MAARTLLLKLEQRGWIQLPARRRSPTNRMRQKPLPAGDLTGQNLALSGALAHLASPLLGRIGQRLCGDWMAKYGHPIYLLESFVDTRRFQGARYQAANWVHVGQTTGRKPGGQPGHPGRTLQPVEKPDHTQVHRLNRCPCGQCGGVSLEGQPVLDYERRQVFDLPPLRLSVTEPQAEIKQCPVSGRRVTAPFPPHVQAPVQYGPHFRGLTLYLFNQHLLRELKFLAEEHHQRWAAELSQFRLDWKDDPLIHRGLEEAQFKGAHARYQAIVRQGRRVYPGRQPGQGRTQQCKAANRLDLLEDYDLSVLAFLSDPRVPFTNNQGEPDLRMIKVKQKISGCFRTLAGAQGFARIRSYLSTCRKQGRNLWEACYQVVIGQPFMPTTPSAGP